MGIEDLPNLNSFIVGAIFVGIFYYWLVWKTSLGFDLRATGLNPVAAKFSGADPNKLIVLAMLISGGIAGLVGMSNLVGYFHRYTIDFPTGLGFAGITVALLGIGANITTSSSSLSPAASSIVPCATRTDPCRSPALFFTCGVASKFETKSEFLVPMIIFSY